jgi:hypothetical protein
MLQTRPHLERTAQCLVALIAFAMTALTGCVRSVVSTEINADGTWKRTVKLYATAPAKDAAKDAGPAAGTLDDTFALPKGPDWKTTRALDKKPDDKKPGQEQAGMPGMPGGDMEVYTATRTCALGETVDHDIAIKGGDGKNKAVEVANLVTVHRLAPNRIEYREVVRWIGKEKPALKFSDIPIPDKEMMAEMKKELPPELVTPEKAKALMQRMMPEMWRVFFGPNDPLIADVFSIAFFPDAMKIKLQRRFGAMFDKVLADTYGNELSVKKRHAIVRHMVDNQTDFVQNSMQKKAAAGPPGLNGQGGDAGGGDFVSMTFSARLPGHIIETNGDADPITGDVYWIFYSPAVQAGEVEMHAVCETN